MNGDDLDNRFTYHAPTERQVLDLADMRAFARNFAGRINLICPDSREKSLAITALEECVMWANAAIARNA